MSYSKNMGSLRFDWFELSKMDANNPDIQQFRSLIRYSQVSNDLPQVPTLHRKKLLITFQNCERALKSRYLQSKNKKQQQEFAKKIIIEQIEAKKIEVHSLARNTDSLNQQLNVAKKKYIRTKQKLEYVKYGKKPEQSQSVRSHRKKTVTNSSLQNSENYYCPFCSRNNFESREIFTFHMYKEHLPLPTNAPHSMTTLQTIKGNQGKVEKEGYWEFKDLLMSLKDREIQLMEKMLNHQKDLKTGQLEKAYKLQLKKIQTLQNFTERRQSVNKSNCSMPLNKNTEIHGESQSQKLGELKGESQYLFYQPENHQYESVDLQVIYGQDRTGNQGHQVRYPHQHVQAEYGRHLNPHANEGNQVKKQIDQYYDIFYSEALPSSEHGSQYSPQPFRACDQKLKADQKDQGELIPSVAGISKSSTQRQCNYNSQSMHRNPSLHSYTQQAGDSYQKQITSKLFNPTLQIHSSDQQYCTMYETKITPERLHIFKSGPLMDDRGGESGEQDYFGPNNNCINHSKTGEEVEDEQIVIDSIHFPEDSQRSRNPQSSDHSSRLLGIIDRNNPSRSNVILQYSKDRSSLDISKQKFSFVADQSCFSKRAFEDSKDETINLSDLKLSKLEKQRKERKTYEAQYNKSEMEPIQEIESIKAEGSYSRNVRNIRNSQQSKQIANRPYCSFLDEFKRDCQKQMLNYKGEEQYVEDKRPVKNVVRNQRKMQVPSNYGHNSILNDYMK